MVGHILDGASAVLPRATLHEGAPLASPERRAISIRVLGQVGPHGCVKARLLECAFNAQVGHAQIRRALGPGGLDGGADRCIEPVRLIFHRFAGVDDHDQVDRRDLRPALLDARRRSGDRGELQLPALAIQLASVAAVRGDRPELPRQRRARGDSVGVLRSVPCVEGEARRTALGLGEVEGEEVPQAQGANDRIVVPERGQPGPAAPLSAAEQVGDIDLAGRAFIREAALAVDRAVGVEDTKSVTGGRGCRHCSCSFVCAALLEKRTELHRTSGVTREGTTRLWRKAPLPRPSFLLAFTRSAPPCERSSPRRTAQPGWVRAALLGFGSR